MEGLRATRREHGTAPASNEEGVRSGALTVSERRLIIPNGRVSPQPRSPGTAAPQRPRVRSSSRYLHQQHLAHIQGEDDQLKAIDWAKDGATPRHVRRQGAPEDHLEVGRYERSRVSRRCWRKRKALGFPARNRCRRLNGRRAEGPSCRLQRILDDRSNNEAVRHALPGTQCAKRSPWPRQIAEVGSAEAERAGPFRIPTLEQTAWQPTDD